MTILPMTTLSGLVQQSMRRTKEATIGVLSISHDGVRTHLREHISECLGSENSFFAEPVFEHTFGWQSSQISLKQLQQDGLLSSSLLDTLANAGKNYGFPSTAEPYLHQLQAWRHLLDTKPQSAIITSGTGSGKTECFMMPILEDLIRQHERNNNTLIGVQALFLYPLNALINSQKDRLDAWTRDFAPHIRYCLYNGNTKEEPERTDIEHPNQILSRSQLRKEPPPILMTNATMLEYMLVRQEDAPIIEISKQNQSLKWIVLDEAHSYIGSQAAEISLLLRRVVQAFGKRPEEIRFVATSATIASQNANEQLKQYLADLAGISPEQVLVVTGKREFEDISISTEAMFSLDEINAIEPEEKCSQQRFEALTRHSIPTTLRQALTHSPTPLNINALIQSCQTQLQTKNLADQQKEVLAWLDVMSQTQYADTEPPFIKLRMHLFQNMLHGLWACINPQCPCQSEPLQSWPFGQLYLQQRDTCECGAAVYETVFCQECGEPYLLADCHNSVLQQHSHELIDEFVLSETNAHEAESDDHDADNDPEQTATLPKSSIDTVLISHPSNHNDAYLTQDFNLKTAQIGTNQHTDTTVSFAMAFTYGSLACAVCNHKPHSRQPLFYRSQRLGAPFYITQAVPSILEFCQEDSKSPNLLPAQGKKLITFTDSRQGTARMAIKMQQEAEYSKLRGMVMEILIEDSKNHPTTTQNNAAIIEALRAIGKSEAEIQAILPPQPHIKDYLTWDEMHAKLTEKDELNRHLLAYNRDVNPIMFGDASGNGAFVLASLLLNREFTRRPRNANSCETLGLVQVDYPALNKITTTPDGWMQTIPINSPIDPKRPLDLADWKAFLKMLLDFYIRENSFVNMSEQQKRWLGKQFSSKSFWPIGSTAETDNRYQHWPLFKRKKSTSQLSRPMKILQAVTGLNMQDKLIQEKVDTWLQMAWNQLIEFGLLESDNDVWRMTVSKMAFKLPKQAWLCPVSKRLIDTTLRGVSPYLPRHYDKQPQVYFCQSIQLPDYTSFTVNGSATPRRLQMRILLNADPTVLTLRQQGLWNNLCDSIMEGGFYYRSAEHSAQLSSGRLDHYEKLFKEGKINVLSCSTTMEMGVDIGNMSAVVMNNVPPHPANYLQRAGRAGRRSEATAIAYTLCKSEPHNQRVFKNPLWPFTTPISAPKVSLSSEPIVQRHVQSLMLSAFLKTFEHRGRDNTKLNAQWFFHPKNEIWKQYCQWCHQQNKPNTELQYSVQRLIHGTALASHTFSSILQANQDTLTRLTDKWQSEYININEKIQQASTENTRYERALKREKKLHESENLLGHLAVNTYLPGYGFPTNVVQLSIAKNTDDKLKDSTEREDNLYIRKEAPSRGLDLALREYAPGAAIVLDGQVYRSAGINLKTKSSGDGKNEIQKIETAWRCQNCGTSGIARYAYSSSNDLECTHCSTKIANGYKQATLIPAGFITDFFEPVSNDISLQKFIKTKNPVIQLNGKKSSLPQVSCGEIHYGNHGKVFYQSAGSHGLGYAICIKCGRAESMTQPDTIPKDSLSQLHLDNHRPLSGGLSLGSKNKECSRANVMSNVYLGHHIQTDVLEIALKNPQTNIWLNKSSSSDQTAKIIARTLAVALRDEIAANLGIEATEMGYAVREDKDLDTHEIRTLIQIYDKANGGAGFALSAIPHITDTLHKAAQRLHCPANCKQSCQFCLSSQDSQVERDHIDRHIALKWLNDTQFLSHLSIPQTLLETAPDCQYITLCALDYLEQHLKSAMGSTLYLHITENNLAEIQSNPHIKSKLMQWKIIYQIELVLCFSNTDLLQQTNVKNTLYGFIQSDIGIVSIPNNTQPAFYSAQLQGQKTITLLHQQATDILTPSAHALFISQCIPLWDTIPCNTDTWFSQANHNSLIRFNHELDGPIQTFGQRLFDLIKIHSAIMETITHDPIVSVDYTDRYLKTPVALLLLLGICNTLKSSSKFERIHIKTTAIKANFRASEKIWDDWQKEQDQIDVYEKIFGLVADKVILDMSHKNSELSHGRLLTLTHQSGKSTTVAFDQGMGYWSTCIFSRFDSSKRFFPFEKDTNTQIIAIMQAIESNFKIETPFDWPSYLMVHIN